MREAASDPKLAFGEPFKKSRSKPLLIILIDCKIFLSPFFDATRMPILTVSFPTKLLSGISLSAGGFSFNHDLNK